MIASTVYISVNTVAIATVKQQGQITIPADVRQALQILAGDRIEFVELAPGAYLFLAVNRSVTELKGMFGKARRMVTIEEMNRATDRRS